MNEFEQEMLNFCNSMGLSQMKDRLSVKLSDIIKFAESGLDGKTTEEIESIVMKAHALSLDLKNQKTSLQSYLSINEKIVRKYVADNMFRVKDTYAPFDYKLEMIISRDKVMSSVHEKIVSTNAKLEKIGDIPYAIDKLIYSIECYMKRRYST